jgi:hypothetical protein
MNSKRKRLWVECAASGIAFAVALATLAWPDWIEILFGIDPDVHSGTLEAAIALTAGVAAIIIGLVARAEWRRDKTVETHPSDA